MSYWNNILQIGERERGFDEGKMKTFVKLTIWKDFSIFNIFYVRLEMWHKYSYYEYIEYPRDAEHKSYGKEME